jgi:hypothetical protein
MGTAASYRAVTNLESSPEGYRAAAGTILQVLSITRVEAGPSANKATGLSRCSLFKRFSTAAAVTIRDIEGGGENQETTIQPQTTNRKSNQRSWNLDHGPGRLNLQASRQTKTYT